ncbi:MAG: CocE/NonD family hydrolase [Pseudomonadota bacterium]|nr:CocE/NonD family hydrolase [Pseudomonadota bacterium]
MSSALRRTALLIATLLLCACGSDGAGTPAVDPVDSAAAVADRNATFHTQTIKFTASDGIELSAFVSSSTEDFRARPLIVEFTPYGSSSFAQQFSAPASFGNTFGTAYNHVIVNARGTGSSNGVWTAIGPRDQLDVAEFLAWACEQPWSDGRIGLFGFSASAIAVYNAIHQPLACVKAASLLAGTSDLYRDLLYPGGILNLAPATVVALGVGAPFLQQTASGVFAGEPVSEALLTGLGMLGLDVGILLHTSLDDYWAERVQRPGPNRFPVLAATSFYDPEPRGPFESYKMLRAQGVQTHLRVTGAHDGFPAGTASPYPDFQRWFDRYVRGIDNGIDREARVQLLVGNGSQAALNAGEFTHIDGDDWPLPGTRWQPLYLDAARAGSASSLNDGSLSMLAVAEKSTQLYLSLNSLPTATDPHTSSTVASAGARTLFDALPLLTQLAVQEPLALTYTTPALSAPVEVVGPANLKLFLSAVVPVSDIYAVLADVWPDGQAYAVGVGRLRTTYPGIDPERSVYNNDGEIVQPYGIYSENDLALAGQQREYNVEFWPIGNRFETGHRMRLYLLGASLFMLSVPGVNAVSIGGDTPSALMLPVIPGSDLPGAIGTR